MVTVSLAIKYFDFVLSFVQFLFLKKKKKRTHLPGERERERERERETKVISSTRVSLVEDWFGLLWVKWFKSYGVYHFMMW